MRFTAKAAAAMLATLLAGAATAQTEVRTLLGIPFGEPFTATSLPQCGNGAVTTTCIQRFEPPTVLVHIPLAALDTQGLLLLSPDGRAQELSLGGSATNYEAVRALFVERFGQPTGQLPGEVRNAAGTRFDQDRSLWQWQTFTIEMHKRSAQDLTRMSLRAFDRPLEEARMKRRAESTKSEAAKL